MELVPVYVQHLKIQAASELVSNRLLISADVFNKNTRHTSQNVDQRRKYKSGIFWTCYQSKKLKHRATQFKTEYLTTLVIIGSVTVSK